MKILCKNSCVFENKHFSFSFFIFIEATIKGRQVPPHNGQIMPFSWNTFNHFVAGVNNLKIFEYERHSSDIFLLP